VKERVLTAIVLAPIVLGALFIANPWPLTVLAAITAYICGREISRLLGRESHAAGAVCALCILLVPRDLPGHGPSLAALAAAALGVFAAWMGARDRRSHWIPLALLWCIAPLYGLLLLHQSSGAAFWNAETLVLFAILPLWGGDTAAIFAGKAFGKHLLAPSISPKKTIEGAVANLLACIAVAIGLAFLLRVDLPRSIGCGLAAGTLGQCGDLFESYVKRKADLKDSGDLLPGHGGVMDRIDSILFTAPAVAVILLIS
jgi:phosphatidate cytidylyltransferase